MIATNLFCNVVGGILAVSALGWLLMWGASLIMGPPTPETREQAMKRYNTRNRRNWGDENDE